jgi:SAM-dependent methyltransferase
MKSILALSLLLPGLLAAQGAPRVLGQKPQPMRLAPSVHTPPNVVDRMLEASGLKAGETLYDLGSGDGRVLIAAAQKFGAKAVGIEISKESVASSTKRIKDLKLEDKVRVIEGDIMAAELADADVVTLYLLTKSNDMIRPLLEKQLKAGARVVSHDFAIPGWRPARIETVTASRREHQLFVYEFPVQKQ